MDTAMLQAIGLKKYVGTATDGQIEELLKECGLPIGKFKDATEEEIASFFDNRENQEIADAMVKMLFPSLESAVAADGMEEENKANFGGSFSSEEDDEELERGEVTGNDEAGFEQSIVASAKASADYWNKAKRVKSSASYQTVRNKPVVKTPRSFSLFDSAKTVINKLKGV